MSLGSKPRGGASRTQESTDDQGSHAICHSPPLITTSRVNAVKLNRHQATHLLGNRQMEIISKLAGSIYPEEHTSKGLPASLLLCRSLILTANISSSRIPSHGPTTVLAWWMKEFLLAYNVMPVMLLLSPTVSRMILILRYCYKAVVSLGCLDGESRTLSKGAKLSYFTVNKPRDLSLTLIHD